MDKYKRNERIGAITQILVSKPNKVVTLTHFTELFSASKSTISEDLVIVKSIFEQQKLGKIETITGAAGGVKYVPMISIDKKENIIKSLADELSKPERRVAGGFIYLSDILFDPKYLQPLGAIFAEKFTGNLIDYVVTVETKGIPLALMTAYALNIPLVTFRNNFKADDGSALSIHYVSGSDGRLKTMYAPKNSIKKGSNILIIDGFMRAGGTIKGMKSLVTELESNVIGVGVLFEEVLSKPKMIEDYFSIFRIDPEKTSDHITIQSDILVGK